MINLPIPDAKTSIDSATTKVGQVVETETMASVEFLSVWNNAPEREPVPRPARGVVDITRAGIMGLMFKRPGGLVPSLESQAAPSIIDRIPKDGEQADTDPLLGEGSKQSKDTLKPEKDLPIDIIMTDVPVSQTVTKTGIITNQIVEGVGLTSNSSPVDSYDKSEKEIGPTTILSHAIPSHGFSLKDNGIPQAAPKQAEFSGAKGVGYVSKAVMPKVPRQTIEPAKVAPPENKVDGIGISQLVKQQPLQQGNITISSHHNPPEPDLPDHQNQTIKVPMVGLVSKPDLIQPEAKQNTPPPPDETVLQLPDRPQTSVGAKQDQASHQIMPIPQERPKQMAHDQSLSERLDKDQSEVSKAGRVIPEHSGSVGGAVANKFTTAVVDTVATPIPAYFPKQVDRKAAILIPKEASEEVKTGMAKSAMTPVQAIPVTVTMDEIGVNDTRTFNNYAPFENPGLPAASLHSAGLTPSHHNVAVTQPEIPQHIARQLADVARQLPERPVELTLNPHELGRVRLTFTLTDGGINVNVLAERGETMDLMRRHIETLAQEFHDIGYADVGFQFSQNGRENAGGNNPGAQPQHTSELAPLPEIENIPPARVSLEPANGLDLRL